MMAHLLADPMFEASGRGPAPNAFFYTFSVTKSQVIWRWWKISARNVDKYSKPGELKESHQDFLDDTWLQSEVRMVFGQDTLRYTKALCDGHFDYLEHLSDALILRIINYLELEDVGRLGRTSQRLRRVCGSEEFWEQTVRKHCNTVSPEVASLAVDVGWRCIFFTNKLQLQKLLSRRRLQLEEEQEGQDQESPGKSSETKQECDSKEESLYSNLSDLSLSTDLTGFYKSSFCDADPHPNSKPDTGSDCIESVPDPFLDDIEFGDAEQSGEQ